MSGEFPERWSEVEVTFMDGEVISHTIKAGAGIARHMTEQAGRVGSLMLLCGAEAHSYPLTNVKGWTIRELDGNPSGGDHG